MGGESGKLSRRRSFDNIGSDRSQAARVLVVPCGSRKDDVVKAASE